MRIVVGLGNPGRAYVSTRHNVGFWVVDRFVSSQTWKFSRRAFQAEIAEGRVDGEHVLVMKPQTFMNRSGEAVAAVRRAFGLEADAFVVVYDDLDLESGRLRLRGGGGTGGHRGVASILEALGDPGFVRVRIGIGRPLEGADPVEWVLEAPEAGERDLLDATALRGAEAIGVLLREGLGTAMNRYNASAGGASG